MWDSLLREGTARAFQEAASLLYDDANGKIYLAKTGVQQHNLTFL